MTRFAFAIAVLCSLATFALGYRYAQTVPATVSTVWSSGPTVTRLESLGHLVSTKVYVADVLQATTNDYRGSWLIKGDALLSIDMTRAKIVESNPKTRTAHVWLPLPKVLTARVDHARTKTWSVEKTTWVPWKGDPDGIRDDAMRQAQELVEFAGNSPENLDHARYCAEAVIQGLYRLVDWQVTIEWEKPSL
jgi:hypothetical protein